MSLAEVLVAMALFGMISTSIALLVNAAATYARRAETRAELQRTSLYVLSSLSRELVETSADCVAYAPTTALRPGVVFASPRGIDGQVGYSASHRLLWKTWVAFYWDRDTGLLYRAMEEISPATPFKPNPVSLLVTVESLAGSAGASRRVLARRVSEFSAEGNREVTVALEVEVVQGDSRSALTTRTAIRPHH